MRRTGKSKTCVKNKFALAALRERDKRSETFREILNGDACHTHLICNAHAQPPDDAGPSVPAPRLKKAEVAKLGAAGTQRARRCRAVDDRDDGYRCGGYGAGSAGGANGINHRCASVMP